MNRWKVWSWCEFAYACAGWMPDWRPFCRRYRRRVWRRCASGGDVLGYQAGGRRASRLRTWTASLQCESSVNNKRRIYVLVALVTLHFRMRVPGNVIVMTLVMKLCVPFIYWLFYELQRYANQRIRIVSGIMWSLCESERDSINFRTKSTMAHISTNRSTYS